MGMQMQVKALCEQAVASRREPRSRTVYLISWTRTKMGSLRATNLGTHLWTGKTFLSSPRHLHRDRHLHRKVDGGKKRILVVLSLELPCTTARWLLGPRMQQLVRKEL